MPVLRHVKGHSGTGGVIRYLTKDGRARAFASHLVEAGEGEWRGFAAADWNAISCEMDATRRDLGRDGDLNKDGNPALKYNHFIISPDPRDGLTAEQVLGLAQEWAGRYLAHYQWAVVVHDDGKVAASRGELGPVHAHIVVNGVDLMTGGTLASYLDARQAKKMYDGLQRMAAKRGWSRFEALQHDEASEDEDEARDERLSKISRARDDEYAPDTPDMAEAAMAREGRPTWKDDMRSRLLLAAMVSSTTEAYVEALDRMGVRVEKVEVAPRESRFDRLPGTEMGWEDLGVERVEGPKARGALYVSKDDPRLRCYAATFGGRYGDAHVARALRKVGDLKKPGRARAAVRERAVELAGAVCGPAAPAPAEVSACYAASSATRLTARQVADALSLVDGPRPERSMVGARMESPEGAAILEAIGYEFPRPFGDGTSYAARARAASERRRREEEEEDRLHPKRSSGRSYGYREGGYSADAGGGCGRGTGDGAARDRRCGR